ncbi:MAG TPA: hypothetical protein VFN36_01870 [Solirubrobacteraceae bacterium]|nr:hypothetical protein [Solirubrobacteraceae bacterium]
MDAVVRHRGWLVALVVLCVAVLAAAVGRRRSAPLAAGGNGPAQVRFGPGTPLPPTVRGLAYTNGWVVRADTGRQGVGVYAGSQTGHRGNGLLVIVRTDARGRRRSRAIVLRGSGPVMLLRPALPLTTAGAAGATLRFLTAAGRFGTLALATYRVTP